MKRRLNYLIIVLLIILPFIPIADIIVPKGYVLDDIFCLILIISSIKIICSTLLIMSHRSYNSNKKDGCFLYVDYA